MTFGKPISSDQQCFTFLLAFQRWVATQRDDKDCSIPSGFTQELRRFLWHPQFDLKLPNEFHFATMGRPESSSYFCVYDFRIKDEVKHTKKEKTDNSDDDGSSDDDEKNDDDENAGGNEIDNNEIDSNEIDSNEADDRNDEHIEKSQKWRMCCVRKWDNDVHTIYVRDRKVSSKLCQYMSGVWTEGSEWEPGCDGFDEATSASDLLFNHWLNPDKWVKENPFIFVHPKDTDVSIKLCPTAEKYLVDGYTQILFVGEEMVPIRLGVRGARMTVAGMVWKDDTTDSDNVTTDNNDNDGGEEIEDNGNGTIELSNSTDMMPKEFFLIIAEGAPFPKHDRERRFKNDMFQWKTCHLYKYHPKKW